MRQLSRIFSLAGTLTALAALVLTLTSVGNVRAAPASNGGSPVEVQPAAQHDVSPPLRQMSQSFHASGVRRDQPLRLLPVPQGANVQPDPVVQSSASTPNVTTTAGVNINGVGDTSNTPANPCNCAPSDTNGAAGATQFVQWVNSAFAVYDKSGNLLMGPTAGNALWSGFGGPCQTNNDGDIIAQYDKAAGRWVLSQFSVTGGPPFFQCVAVSTTSDATGTYNRYAFQEPNFNDYPKLGIWPDGYYFSFNMFSGNTFVGARACAFDRNQMLAGAAATQVCFQQGSTVGSLLPSDVDGTIAPAAGEPDFYLNFGSNVLNLFKFHVDFTTPTNSTFTGPTIIPVAAFTAACSGGGTCIPQPNTSNKLDSLADRLMYRLAWRKFSDGHESLVVNHSVTVSGSKRNSVTGVRWYEIRNPNGTPSVFQQGTFSPDANSRWMGSIAMDKFGDIAMGYSESSGSLFPSIAFTGRVPSDPLGTMEAENLAFKGSGSQTGSLHRWGDYSSISVDPVDDCTFWYTTEYLATSGSFNWSTRIISFKFPGC
ncbi:MAG TPA: hypothetical protein VKY19_01420 [Ktedonosporobacter sp.]|jgi:hypothetical protein|nr:hypothetical protein [Ktedonosporobacter sp.]